MLDASISVTGRRLQLGFFYPPLLLIRSYMLCMCRNLPQAPRCESCFDTRDKGERPYHGHAASPTHQDSGARGGDTFTGTRPNGEKILPVGEIEIWTKLAELRDFSTDNLLAAFPEGLSEIQGRGKRARK